MTDITDMTPFQAVISIAVMLLSYGAIMIVCTKMISDSNRMLNETLKEEK